MKLFWKITPLIIFLMFAFFLWRGLSLNPKALPSVKVGQSVPTFSLSGLTPSDKTLTQTVFKGQMTLLNVWASWCQACLEEQSFLMKLSREGFRIYGLNYKDSPDKAQQWLAEWGNPFIQVGSDIDGNVAIDLGVYGAPETFLVGKEGKILLRYAGPLNENVWQKQFVPLIKNMGRTKDV